MSLIAMIYKTPIPGDKSLKSNTDKYWIAYGNSKFGAYKISKSAHRNIAHIKTNTEGLDVWVHTDIDSLKISLLPGDTVPIKIIPSGKEAIHKLKIVGLSSKWQKEKLSFLKESKGPKLEYQYPVLTPDYLSLLKNTYPLDDTLKDAKTDVEILTAITSWAHAQWSHNGGNVPSKSNAHTILQEVAQGKNFRCVEYSIVISELMQALGYRARVLGLKQKECETLLTNAGHAVAEVFLPQFNKWVFADGQFNVVPRLDGTPLNAVEFQEALTKETLTTRLRAGNTEIPFEKYTAWVYPYLFYFDFKVQFKDPSIEQTSLMLVPQNERKPRYFQKKWGVGNCLYTSELHDFYAIPQNLQQQ